MKAGWRSPVSCRQHDDAAPSPLRGALMALATQCPFCQTTFRVANDQLKLRGGLVRCGACNEVFNGSEHLVDPDAAANLPATPANQASSAAVPSATTIADTPRTTNTFVPPAVPPQQNLSSAFAGIAAETEEGPWFTPRQEQPPEARDEPLPSTTPDASADHTADSFPVPLVSSAPPAADELTRLSAAAAAERAAADEEPAAIEPEELEEDPEQDEEYEDEDTPDFVRKAERRQRLGRVTRVLMQIGALLLTLTLLTQATYFWRNQIVGWLPPLQPAFASVCALLHCTVGLPTDISQLSLESSELQLLPPNQNIYTLTLVMRNRSHTAQTWPYLELTLNDGEEKAITRRVFTPREYLATPATADGIAAGSEQQVKMVFELAQPAASGYRLYLFYP